MCGSGKLVICECATFSFIKINCYHLTPIHLMNPYQTQMNENLLIVKQAKQIICYSKYTTLLTLTIKHKDFYSTVLVVMSKIL